MKTSLQSAGSMMPDMLKQECSPVLSRVKCARDSLHALQTTRQGQREDDIVKTSIQ